MKIGFLTSKRAERQFPQEYRMIVEYLQEKGHEVTHHMDVPLEKILPLSYAERQELFMKFYQNLAECDLVFADTSIQSTQVGFGLAYLRLKGLPVVILSQGEVANQFFPRGEVYSNLESMMAYQYNKSNIKEKLTDALDFMSQHVDKRFTIIFPPHLLNKIEAVARKKKLPKSVFIRQLIEEDLKHQEV